MKSKDVSVGGEYMTKVGGVLVKVKVTGGAPPVPRSLRGASGREGPPRFYCQRVDNETRLPKPRTAAALRPIEKSTTEEPWK